VARLGGDEFAILCEGIEGHRGAIEVAQRVLVATEGRVDIDGRALRAGVSIGIAVDDGQRSGQDLLRDADIALYEAKADGKQRWSIHRRRMTERAQARLQLAADLGAAVESGRMEVAFQPIVRLSDLRVTGVESLARWEHPEHGWVAPAEFVPLAESTGQIVALGDLVLQQSLAALARWNRDGMLDLRMGVNVSARQVRDPGLPARVAGWLAEHRVDPGRLVLELTESVMLDEADEAIEVMSRLRELGVRFAVDDFGTGYSSLAYLRRLPVDIVKTDRAFVRDLGSDEASEDLVRAVVEMARSLRLDVVAEGVETAAQLAALHRMGCGFAQGYLFSRPVSAEALLPRLTQGVELTELGGRSLVAARRLPEAGARQARRPAV
jgi:predicted signal transduction protein with EAL and GGDEF domain